MKTKFFILILLLSNICTFAQNADKRVEDDVSRIIRTLSSDSMRGRSALMVESIEPATVFIESEFREIGLDPMKGLKTFRQEFTKERISPEYVQVVVDGKSIRREDVIFISDHENIEMSSGLSVVPLTYNLTVFNTRQYFFQKAYAFMNDTSSAIMVVAPEFREAFVEFKGYFENHFVSNKKFTKVYILTEPSIGSYSIKANQKIEKIVMTNVVGVIPGRTKPDEIVLFSAHYDHIGILSAIQGDSIANGADDNASGTTAVIELARHFKKKQENNRTLIFVAFTAEEIGGLGSKHFSEQLDPENIIAMINIEMIGKQSKWGKNVAFMTGYERSDLGSILEKNVQGTEFSFKPDPYPELGLFYRSDNATLARLGVPAHTISTDQIDVDKFYHTVDDEFETLDIKNIISTIRAIAAGSRSLVDGTDTPTRIDKTLVE